jgi:hypothetical protein
MGPTVEDVMRRTAIAGAVLGVVVLTGSPALAAAPRVTQKNCTAAGGIFSLSHRIKTCTVVTQQVADSGPTTLVATLGTNLNFETWTGVSNREDVIQTTTTRSEKGTGRVTTTQTSTIVSSTVTPLSCQVTASIVGITTTTTQPFDICAAHRVFLLPSV